MINEIQLYINDAPPAPPELATGWQMIATASGKVDALIEGHALALQGILAEEAPMADRIAKYRAEHTALVETRKKFTAFTDWVKDNKMATEKQYSPTTYTPFVALVASELAERMQTAKNQQAAVNKQAEAQRLRAHIANEYTRVETDYRLRLRSLMHECYTHCLAARTPSDQVQNAIDICVAAMSETTLAPYAEFTATLHTQEEQQAIGASVPAPNWNTVWSELLAELPKKFELYPNDLANAEVALLEEAIQHDAQVRDVQDAATQEIAVTNLVASATPLVEDAVVVKEKTQIVIKDDTTFVVAILSAFLQHAQKCLPKVRVKKLSNLTISQMAAALTDADVTVSGIEYMTIQK